MANGRTTTSDKNKTRVTSSKRLDDRLDLNVARTNNTAKNSATIRYPETILRIGSDSLSARIQRPTIRNRKPRDPRSIEWPKGVAPNSEGFVRFLSGSTI